MAKLESSSPSSLAVVIPLLIVAPPGIPASMRRLRRWRDRTPCYNTTLYFHDIIYNGRNVANVTSAIVGAPVWANRTLPGPLMDFGDMVVFDDPITTDNNLHSPPVGRAQGLYMYDRKEVFTAWLAFSFVLNSTTYPRGTLQFVGVDPLLNKTRDISVVGGTGKFAMSRGIATFMTDGSQGAAYFRIRVDIRLYECY